MSNIEFDYTAHTMPYTYRGVTISSAGSHKFKLEGTPTGTVNFFLYQGRAKPSWLEYDKDYQLVLEKSGNTDKVTFLIQTRVGSKYTNQVLTANDLQFRIPTDNYNYFNITLRMTTSMGAIDETVYPYIYKLPDYTPRLNSQGIEGNPHYESRNPFYLAGYGMPNCTAYAFGRAWEIADPDNQYINYPPLSTGNADSWYNHADNWPRGSTPALGAIACYSGGDFSGDGHVCVVEEIDTANNRCRVSESAYNGYYFRATHYISYNGDYGYGNYHFDGFIYNPYAGDTPGPGPGPIQGFDIWKFKPLIYKKKGKCLT